MSVSARAPALLGIDGRSGSGKTELAAGVAAILRRRGLRTATVPMDALYAGWAGVADSLPVVCDDVIEPLRLGSDAAYRQWDWIEGRWSALVSVPPGDVVIIEGVGATTHRCREAFAVTVWVQAEQALRFERACHRKGQGDFLPHAQQWVQQEDALFGPDGYPAPPTTFDIVVDTSTGWAPGDG